MRIRLKRPFQQRKENRQSHAGIKKTQSTQGPANGTVGVRV